MESTGSAGSGGSEGRGQGDRPEATRPGAALAALATGVAQAVAMPLGSVASNVRALAADLERLAANPAALSASLAGLRQAAADAARGAERAGEVVRALQLLGARGAGSREAVDLRAELSTAAELARGAVSQRAQLAVELPPALPRVTAAPGELGLAVASLLLGAADALPEGRAGQVALRLSARAVDGRAFVEVTDDGTAAPDLAIARAAAAAAGGTVEAARAPGRGTTVTISLPAAPAASAAPGARPAPSAAKRGRVLVVDDDPLVGRSMARLLQASHDVTVITSPAEAVGRIEAGERWDVVLCDLMMPELSGMDVEERLARSVPEMVPRIVYLTGGAFTDKARAFLGGGRPYLEKPVEAPTLRSRVSELVRQRAG
jgi:CheY-like chemotaxis protein